MGANWRAGGPTGWEEPQLLLSCGEFAVLAMSGGHPLLSLLQGAAVCVAARPGLATCRRPGAMRQPASEEAQAALQAEAVGVAIGEAVHGAPHRCVGCRRGRRGYGW
jgi:hypothetical protein